MIRFGIDSAELAAHIPGRAALVTAPSGRSADNRSSIDVLKGICDLRLLLAPEHGVRGDKAAGEVFSDSVDAPSGLRVKSLYRPGSKRLTRETASEFDTLVYDIQDVGCRYYTFISTLKNLLFDCAEYGKRLVVLDRPDPLGRTAGTFALTGGVCLANERDDSEDARSLLPDLRRETAIWRNKHVGVGEDGKSIWFPS